MKLLVSFLCVYDHITISMEGKFLAFFSFPSLLLLNLLYLGLEETFLTFQSQIPPTTSGTKNIGKRSTSRGKSHFQEKAKFLETGLGNGTSYI